jgi:Glycerol-3-phosphate O-acyltransferase
MVLKAMFEGITVDTEGLNRIKLMAQKGPVILIPCHKSHFDYLILSFLLHNSNLPCPHVAAGKNLSFWPLGPLFRGGGAFFIRRTFRGAALYSKVFSEYIHKLLQEGFNIEFFIEGGRSRTGKLILPKLGLLSILLGAYRNGACEDMSFAPIFIGYDQVLEENAYLSEVEGEQKKPENIMQVFKARKLLKKRYGRIYVKFDEPISIVDLQQKMGVSLHTMNAKDQNVLIRNLGYRVINAINQVSVVTPYALVAGVLLNLEKERFSYEQFKKGLDTYMTFLISHKATLADTLVVDPEHAVEKVLSNYIQRKFIESISGEKRRSLYRYGF